MAIGAASRQQTQPRLARRPSTGGYPKLKLAIINAGWTQRQVAFTVRMPEARISDLIHGRGAPVSGGEKKQLARLLGPRIIADVFSQNGHGSGP